MTIEERAVVDTNVLITANNHTDCARKCATRLNQFQMNGKIILDDGWHILREYGRHLAQPGPLRPGHLFYQWILSNRANLNRIEYHTLHYHPANPGEFTEFPANPSLAGFDPNDRKFASLAAISGAPVWNAVDSDWWNCREALQTQGITVEFLCPEQFAD